MHLIKLWCLNEKALTIDYLLLNNDYCLFDTLICLIGEPFN